MYNILKLINYLYRRGYLGPGGLYKGGFDWNCTGGATGYIDRKIVGYEHLYQHSTAKPIYESLAFDPEGLFGKLNQSFLYYLTLCPGRLDGRQLRLYYTI